ncbi:uncharacterized protein VTP21DRAFT_6772 [Calcarisporiella thermophila]|uniref:uncharacterized protein n=1 Tax=Calcarisporiella thermophila TaxID=911321 RepID=UPI003742CDBA
MENQKQQLEALLGSTSRRSETTDYECVFATDEAFKVQYQDPHDILTHMKNYLYWCHRERNQQKTIEIVPFVPIIQSSGYGKTRMIAELAGEIHTLYICNRTSASTGYPPASPNVEYFFSQLRREKVRNIGTASEVQPFALVMLAAAQEVKDSGLSPSEFWQMQIYDRTACNKFWENVMNRHQRYRSMRDEELKAKLGDEDFILKLFGNVSDRDRIVLLCCIDEAHMLFDEAKARGSGDRSVKFRMWRRAIRSIKWRGFFSVCLSTGGKIGDFFPTFDVDTSARERGFTHFQPFVDVATKDALVPDARPECPTPLQLVQYGRPLFGALARDESFIPEVLTLAATKLHGTRVTGSSMEGALARLACLTAIKLSLRADLTRQMVADHMATALGISPNRCDAYITYPSEPVLAAGALAYYGDEETWSRDIHWLAEALSEGFADSGECGEAAARIALLRAMQKACQANYTSSVDISFCKPVSVKEFLSSLVLEDKRLACNVRSTDPGLNR